MKYAPLLIITTILLTGCKDTNWKSSVPDFPVHIEINTRAGMFVNFVPDNVTTYLIVDDAGYHLNGINQPLLVTDAWGYAGTVIYIDGVHPYGAYDLCCPHCVERYHPIEVNGMFAVCPVCGEDYDLSYGYGVPTQGIAKNYLKTYKCNYNTVTGKLVVYN